MEVDMKVYFFSFKEKQWAKQVCAYMCECVCVSLTINQAAYRKRLQASSA